MKTSLFDFELPSELIANQPISPRDAARMLVVADELNNSHVANLIDYLQAGDVMVFNDTRVIPARLNGKKGREGANIELTLTKNVSGNLWKAFAKNSKRLKINDIIYFAEDFSAILIEKLENGEIIIDFKCANFSEALQKYGKMPLPPYIKRNSSQDTDNNNYQTVYAKNEGAIAAPTAGLHFTDKLLNSLKEKGVIQVFVTLHVGAGTFLPVKTDDTNDHKMHSEYAEISSETADIINAAKASGKRIIAVGTTSLRVLESAAKDSKLEQFAGETDIFIIPGYKFQIVDVLMTNFHLPKSTLFMLVSAFAGLDKMQNAYAHAIKEKYRFYSYGDACLLFR